MKKAPKPTSTKIVLKDKILISFNNGKIQRQFFVERFTPSQLEPPRKIGRFLKPGEYNVAALRSCKRSTSLTPNELVLIGRIARKTTDHQKAPGKAIVRDLYPESNGSSSGFTDKQLDFHVSKMMDRGRYAPYQVRKAGPDLIVVCSEGNNYGNVLERAAVK